MSENMWMFYEKWIETEEYKNQSAIENNMRDDCKKAVEKVIGQKQYDDIEDNILDLASEAEKSGFCNGFRIAVLFMNEMLKGGVV